jgi:ubiquinone biosynthesis protein UbiJ
MTASRSNSDALFRMVGPEPSKVISAMAQSRTTKAKDRVHRQRSHQAHMITEWHDWFGAVFASAQR